MNQTFLEIVAQDIIAKHGTDLARTAVVFPNKRAALFMNQHLARLSSRPIWSPAYITISELFRQNSSRMIADPIKLICDLHKSFTTVTRIDESLDHFYSWGEIMLADFDDIDKNMADASKVFKNLKDIHELDDISYLSEEQKGVLKRFFTNFSDDHNTELKRRFLNLWSHFEDIYNDFNQRLSRQNLAYEGALYRAVATDADIHHQYDKYIFVGFNLIQPVEQTLFQQLKEAGKALFYWDFDHYYMAPQKHHEAGTFISQYLKKFPNELDGNNKSIYDNLRQNKEVTYIGTSTKSIQARYIGEWLKAKKRLESGIKTAIVLCDENLLQTAILSIPESAQHINITTGIPLKNTPAASFVDDLIQLQTQGIDHNKQKFRLKNVLTILKSPFIRYISSRFNELGKSLRDDRRFFLSPDELKIDEPLGILFKPVSRTPENQHAELCDWMLRIIQIVATNTKDKSPLLQESIYRIYTLINRIRSLIHDEDIRLDVKTLQRLIKQVVSSTSIPFHGEPASGIQVMGVLETRNLDFDHMLILSCDEQNMPKGINDSSFIPYAIRKAYGLTTTEHKVALYSYYFHRMIQRASDITLVYNQTAGDKQRNEMSRFMLQLMIESPLNIRHKNLQPNFTPTANTPQSIKKSARMMEKLYAMEKLSPTAINRYLGCQLRFYYDKIAGIKEPETDEVNEVDNRIFGNIFHRAAELIYLKLTENGGTVAARQMEEMIKHPRQIEDIVDQAFREELFQVKNNRFKPEYTGLHLINRRVIIDFLRQMLKNDCKIAPLTIRGLEQEIETTVEVNCGGQTKELRIGGIIDRLDEFDTDKRTLRILDYKTGAKATENIKMEDIFSNKDRHKNHADYFLQTILYSVLVKNDKTLCDKGQSVIPALLFIQKSQAEDYDPTLAINNEKIEDIQPYEEEFIKQLKDVVNDIFNPHKDFLPTEHKESCKYCPYKGLCYL